MQSLPAYARGLLEAKRSSRWVNGDAYVAQLDPSRKSGTVDIELRTLPAHRPHLVVQPHWQRSAQRTLYVWSGFSS